MEESSRVAQPPQSSKVILNSLIAWVLMLLGIWMTVADFSHPGDLLFQGSPSILLAALAGVLLFLVLIGVAALPKRILIGANLLLLARCSLGFPLNWFAGNTTACRIITLGFLALALGYLFLSLVRGKRQLFAKRPWVSVRHSLIAGTAFVAVGVLSVPVMVLGYIGAAKNLLGDYVSVAPRGMELVERVFEKDGQQVHLVGMMHIGDGGYYSELKTRLRATPAAGGKRLVLTEGVSDRHQILPPDFSNGATYERWAKWLGLETQKALGPHSPPRPEAQNLSPEPGEPPTPNVVWENADSDVSDLPEKHRLLLISMLKVMSSSDFSEILQSRAATVSGEEIEDLMKHGLILSRNDELMRKFSERGAEFREIYIPWGAAHLPDIQRRLLEMGYRQTEEIRRPIVRFWK